MEKNFSDEQLGPYLEYFIERLNRVFAYSFSLIEFKGDENIGDSPHDNTRAWQLQTIQNACLHESLMALRDLNDFLTPRDKHSKKDDLKASDFGYNVNCSFLTDQELKEIHKRVAHTTTTGISEQGKPWDIWELTAKCIAQCLTFLKWIESEYGMSHFMLYTAALIGRTRIGQIYNYVAKELSMPNKVI